MHESPLLILLSPVVFYHWNCSQTALCCEHKWGAQDWTQVLQRLSEKVLDDSLLVSSFQASSPLCQGMRVTEYIWECYVVVHVSGHHCDFTVFMSHHCHRGCWFHTHNCFPDQWKKAQFIIHTSLRQHYSGISSHDSWTLTATVLLVFWYQSVQDALISWAGSGWTKCDNMCQHVSTAGTQTAAGRMSPIGTFS